MQRVLVKCKRLLEYARHLEACQYILYSSTPFACQISSGLNAYSAEEAGRRSEGARAFGQVLAAACASAMACAAHSQMRCDAKVP